MPHPSPHSALTPGRQLPQRGFTLIELLVAMLLGLVTVLVVAQVMLMTESRKRTTTSGSDANVNSAMALHTIERDARNAGFGMTTVLSAIGCEIRAKHDSIATAFTFTLTPVTIEQGASTAPDKITFMSSTKDGVPLPATVKDHPNPSAVFKVSSSLGIAEGDLMIAVPPAGSTDWCSVFEVTQDTSGKPNPPGHVNHNSGKSHWNPPGGANIFPAAGYANGTLINLGTWARRTYSIVDNGMRLTWLDTVDGLEKTRDLYPQIIQLQAEYGMDDTVDDVTKITSWTVTTPTTSADWQKVKAVRVAVVARSDVYEKDTVTIASTDADCKDPTKRSPRAVCWAGGAINVKSSATDTEWDHYRYRVYEAVIPIRNVIWRQ